MTIYLSHFEKFRNSAQINLSSASNFHKSYLLYATMSSKQLTGEIKANLMTKCETVTDSITPISLKVYKHMYMLKVCN